VGRIGMAQSTTDEAGGAEDDALLQAVADGDMRAARALSERHLARVLAHAGHLLGNAAEAEDVAQEAMLRLWRIAPDWMPGRARVSTWLYRVVANLCTDQLRRRRGIALDDVPEPADERPDVEAEMHRATRARALGHALMRLPERQRQAVVLRHLDGLGNARIAQIMEISVDAVESLLARGKRTLSSDLLDQREELGLHDG